MGKFLLGVVFFFGFFVLNVFASEYFDKKLLLEKANRGELSEEEYEVFIKYGLCKPLKKNFLEDRERGWAYGEFCTKDNLMRNYKGKKKEKNHNKPVKDRKKEKKAPFIVGMTGTGSLIESFHIDRKRIRDDEYLDSLSAKQFRYLIQELMDEATYNPTPKSVEDYLYVQDYMARKSLKFARVWQQVILSNPKLGGYGRFTRSQWEEKVYYQQKKEDRKRFFNLLKKEFGKTVGLYIFVSGNCKYCHIEMEAIHNLIADYGAVVITVSSDFCPKNFPNCKVMPKAFKKFNISVTPTVVLVVKDSTTGKLKFQTIAVGLVSESVLVNRIVYYYKFFKEGKHIDDRTIIWGVEDR